VEEPDYAYLPIDSRHVGAGSFAEAVGAHHIADLDVDAGGHVTECHLLDYGAGGLLGMQREYVYRELGLTPAPPDADAVRDALRNLRVPHALASSRLARPRRMRFLAGAGFDDELDLAVSVEHMGRTSLVTRHRIERDDELVVEGKLRHVFVEAGTAEKAEIPAWVREALAPWAEAARSVG
jgi:acyl-CoA thioesterase FadM